MGQSEYASGYRMLLLALLVLNSCLCSGRSALGLIIQDLSVCVSIKMEIASRSQIPTQ